jgi:two-component system OmpR family sensor kinase
MQKIHSIRARLSIVFLFLFLVLCFLGLQALGGLRDVDVSASEIRQRWLPGTRALGDLNNYTTDVPPIQATLSRSNDSREIALLTGQMTRLDRDILDAEQAYRAIGLDPIDEQMLTRFILQWNMYRRTAAPVDYDAASSALAALTARNIEGSRTASERSDSTYRQARRRIAYALALAALLMSCALIYVTRSISAPLMDLAARMRRLAADDTQTAVRETRRQDEIGEMARAVLVFRNNAVDLAASRVTLTRQAQALHERLQEEQRLTLLQRNFVSMASHEFRTPLGIIDGHAQRLVSLRERLTTAELQERSARIRNMVRRMTQLIDNLIGSSRLIDGGIGLHFSPTRIDLCAVLNAECRLQRELQPEAQIEESYEREPLLVRGDATLLCQAFGNLLSNAVKYSPNGGLIRVFASSTPRGIAVIIEDHGIGVPLTDRQRIFERYFRGTNTAGIVGSGVGLYLVKAIVDLHEGSIALESREEAGVRLIVHLPGLDAKDFETIS